MSVLIFANGDIKHVDWVRPYLTQPSAIIAADGGVRHLLALNVLPDAVVGDMDSLSAREERWLAASNSRIFRVPAEKDETDLELAMIYAVTNYPEELLVFGAFGGRMDQTLGNIFLLAHPAFAGRPIQLLDEYQRVWMITPADGQVAIYGRSGDTLSFLPCGADVHVRTTSGLGWPMRQEALAFGPARGLSNRMTADIASIEIVSGRLICIHTQQRWQR